MLKKIKGNFSKANDWYNSHRKKITLSSRIKIKNKRLAKELEDACLQQNGILTYAEYLHITQFGINGFYTTSTMHGKTDIETRWGKALGHYCQQHGYDTIVEIGCGTGELAIAMIEEYKRQTKKMLSWIGIEIDAAIHKKIYANFQRHNITNAIESIGDSLEIIKKRKNTLFIFPYSIDNFSPQVFLNTNLSPSSPNVILGVTVENDLLSEIIIPPALLQKKGISLENGIATLDGHSFGLSSWKLRKGQRAYIALDAFITLASCAKKCAENTSIMIIDEFIKEPWFFSLGNLGTPKSLYENNLLYHERNRYYRESGKHNFYHPMYLYTLFHFLHAIGFRSIQYEVEQKMAAQLRGDYWIPLRKGYNTYAFSAMNRIEKQNDILPIRFNPKRIV